MIERIEVDLIFNIAFPTAPPETDLRFDVHGQYVLPQGVGAYVTAPISYGSGAGGPTTTTLGDVEIGGIFVPRLGPSTLQLVLHGGLTLPTQSRDYIASGAARFAVGPRITDYYLSAPEAFTLRLGVSPIIKAGHVFFRCDLGVDVGLSAPDDGNVAHPLPNVFRGNAGLGIDMGAAAVMLELANLYLDYGGFDDVVWVNTLAMSARYDAGSVSPYAAIVVGLDHGGVNEAGSMHDAITVGVEARLR